MFKVDHTNAHSAKFWQPTEGGRVRCTLTPRGCLIQDGRTGFCGVRKNVNGKLLTLNYGKSVNLTEEMIESEAVYHYAPGSKILSLGNIGCMMNCDFCQNWRTSQVVHLNEKDICNYTSESIVETALNRGIGMLSWTYNDPVVWHEFVVDTAKLAAQHGIQNLYKSAFYISKDAVAELCEVIDVFSISLKSMSPSFYKTVTKAELEPVLDAIKIVVENNKYLEISQLVVTDLNDTVEDAREISRWILDNIGNHIPLHFVRFHPDYKYIHVDRTPVNTLLKAREAAINEGIKYCYLGNLYQEGVSNTYCSSCGDLLVRRFGLDVTIHDLNQDGTCNNCGEPSGIITTILDKTNSELEKSLGAIELKDSDITENYFSWDHDVNALHIVIPENIEVAMIEITRMPGEEINRILLGKKYGLHRYIVSRANENEKKITIKHNNEYSMELFPVLDRAHFPVTIDWKGNSPDNFNTSHITKYDESKKQKQIED